MELVITIWLMCGIIAVLIATNKGQKEFKTLFPCVVFGPIGLLLAVKTKRLKMHCPYCDEIVDTEKNRCSLCGLELEETDSIGGGIVSKQCPKCGERDVHDAYIENGSWGKWCPNCKMSIKKIRGN